MQEKESSEEDKSGETETKPKIAWARSWRYRVAQIDSVVEKRNRAKTMFTSVRSSTNQGGNQNCCTLSW